MREPIETILGVTEDLNHKLFNYMGEKFQSENGWIFEYSSDGFSESISFNGTNIWCSENEEREWIEENNDYENLEQFIMNKLTKYGRYILFFTKLNQL